MSSSEIKVTLSDNSICSQNDTKEIIEETIEETKTQENNNISAQELEIMNMFKIKDIKKNKIIKKKDNQSESENNSDNDDDDDFGKDNNSDDNDDDFGNFSTNPSWTDFSNPTNDLEEMMNNKIEIKTQARGRKKTTVVVGLVLDKEKEKKFVTQVKKKMAVTGNKKSVNEEELSSGSYHRDKSKRGQPKPKNVTKVDIFVFSGDCKEAIQTILINDYDVSEDKIICDETI